MTRLPYETRPCAGPSAASLALALVLGVVLNGAAVTPLRAGEADVVAAEAQREASGAWRFRVTLRHDDSGWDHYADRWDVVGPDGAVLGSRVLLHPHENEQPFTRSLGGVAIPDTVSEVTIRAHDSVHNYGGEEMTVSLPR